MDTEALRLDDNFRPYDIIPWYEQAKLGDILTIEIPGRSAAVQLICNPNAHVHWWPQGDRGVTVSLDHAVQRLVTLQEKK